MQVTWNGTGAAWATYYGNASAVVEAGGQRLLIDCGHTVPGRLRQMGLSLSDMDAVFISHLHGDHLYGLEEWGFRNFLQWDLKPRLLIAEEMVAPLWSHILSGTMGQVCDRACVLDDYFTVTPLHAGQSYALGPFQIETHPVHHVPHAHSYGVKVRADDVTLGFSCDSLADAANWLFLDTALVFHDCSFKPYFPTTVHAHFEQLRIYPQAYREKMMLVHYEDDVREKRADPVWQADLASTGMRLTDPFVPIP
jgi:hydroxyacylglutathione hydrolase